MSESLPEILAESYMLSLSVDSIGLSLPFELDQIDTFH
jgi:hypothetical protein